MSSRSIRARVISSNTIHVCFIVLHTIAFDIVFHYIYVYTSTTLRTSINDICSTATVVLGIGKTANQGTRRAEYRRLSAGTA